MLKIWTAV